MDQGATESAISSSRVSVVHDEPWARVSPAQFRSEQPPLSPTGHCATGLVENTTRPKVCGA